jgi:uncharacterized membrane protein required for colicin V production
MLLNLLLLVIFAACVGFGYRNGLWSNAIRLVNVITAALLATNFFEPVADWLQGLAGSYQYFMDLVALWGLFVVFLGGMSLLTDFASRVKVRFATVVDRVGAAFFSAWVGWVMIGFTLATLHTAPLPREFLFHNFQAEQRMFFGLAPDRQWLAFVQKMSRGPLCRSATADQWRREATVFDPAGEFMIKYATRRTVLEEHAAKTGTVRTQ